MHFLILFFLAGYSTTDVLMVKWTHLDIQEEVATACRVPKALGCYRIENYAGHIYALKNQTAFAANRLEVNRTDGSFHMVVGHELDHCVRGEYHTA